MPPAGGSGAWAGRGHEAGPGNPSAAHDAGYAWGVNGSKWMDALPSRPAPPVVAAGDGPGC
jgi:hypothetical protein